MEGKNSPMVRPDTLPVSAKIAVGWTAPNSPAETADAATSTRPPFLYTHVAINRQRFSSRPPFLCCFSQWLPTTAVVPCETYAPSWAPPRWAGLWTLPFYARRVFALRSFGIHLNEDVVAHRIQRLYPFALGSLPIARSRPQARQHLDPGPSTHHVSRN